MNDPAIGVGVIGCGGFGHYALQHFTQIPGARLVGMAGTHREAAFAAAQRFGMPDPVEVEDLVSRDEVDLIYIATPPFLHYPHAMAALNAGKHVICEKPLAMNLNEADEMIAVAQKQNLCLVANLMQRYNPLFDRVRDLIASEALGKVLHGYFENYATDEGLPAEHWFWDRTKSGGIFIEHGVHFFDMFRGWLGEGEVESAQLSKRGDTDIEDQVQCTVRYGQECRVNFYHGFTQVGRMDRQEFRLLFERGDITLYEWVPNKLKMRGIADELNTGKIMEIFPGARLDITENYAPKDRACKGRHQELDVYQMFDLTFDEGVPKMHRYGELLRSMFSDQFEWIRHKEHARVITEDNGRASLAMAIEADRLARAAR
jgi:predicted dehydrogenase